MSTLKNNKIKTRNKFQLKKSQILLFGSLLIFLGTMFLSWDFLLSLRDEIYSDMMLAFSTTTKDKKDVPITKNIKDKNGTIYDQGDIDYGEYLGVLSIPKIGLRRGFLDVNSRYNNIQYNVTMLRGSSTPDVKNGNLMLIAHSGDAYISYFAYLYRLEVGDKCYVKYNGYNYEYHIVKIYNTPKTGKVTISRNYDKTTLTLITCTKDSDTLQTVYIAEAE